MRLQWFVPAKFWSVGWIQRSATLFVLAIGVQLQGSVLAQAPPPPSEVPANGSLVTATVLHFSTWPPGSLEGKLPIVFPDQTLDSLTVKIQTSQPANPLEKSLAVPGSTVEVFSRDRLSSDLVGKRIEAILQLTGDTRGVRWWISKVRSF
jgi:hypothetical protein